MMNRINSDEVLHRITGVFYGVQVGCVFFGGGSCVFVWFFFGGGGFLVCFLGGSLYAFGGCLCVVFWGGACLCFIFGGGACMYFEGCVFGGLFICLGGGVGGFWWWYVFFFGGGGCGVMVCLGVLVTYRLDCWRMEGEQRRQQPHSDWTPRPPGGLRTWGWSCRRRCLDALPGGTRGELRGETLHWPLEKMQEKYSTFHSSVIFQAHLEILILE